VKKVLEEISIKRPFCGYIVSLADEIHSVPQQMYNFQADSWNFMG